MSGLNIHHCNVSKFVDGENARRIMFLVCDVQNDSISFRHSQFLYQIDGLIHLTGLEEYSNGIMTRDEDVMKVEPVPSFSEQRKEVKSFKSIE